MAVGFPLKTTYANGDVYSAGDVNDTNGTINLLGSSVAYAAGKNKIINGDFGVWQRGTSFASIASNVYFADRFGAANTAGGGTITFSRQTFTPGTAPVSGYESAYYARLAVTSGSGSTVTGCWQKIEDVRTLAGQTATISFWAKADSARTLSIYTVQDFGSGGSSGVVTSTTRTLTTSWARYTYTLNLASISGKTIGTSSYLYIAIELGAGQASGTVALDTWGWQVEEGSTATAFQTATGTIQGELALCQRYYYRQTAQQVYSVITTTQNISTTQTIAAYTMPVTMRVAPTAVEFSTLALQEYSTGGLSAVTVLTLEGNVGGLNTQSLLFTVSSGLTTNRVTRVLCNNSLSAYLGLSAEL
jgi:hypothetical protein